MASIAASTAAAFTVESEVSLIRHYVLRATYLLLVVGLGAMMLPPLLSHPPMARGVIPSLLGALWLLAFLGLRYPLRMLPLLLFEFAWKTMWFLDSDSRNGFRVSAPRPSPKTSSTLRWASS